MKSIKKLKKMEKGVFHIKKIVFVNFLKTLTMDLKWNFIISEKFFKKIFENQKGFFACNVGSMNVSMGPLFIAIDA